MRAKEIGRIVVASTCFFVVVLALVVEAYAYIDVWVYPSGNQALFYDAWFLTLAGLAAIVFLALMWVSSPSPRSERVSNSEPRPAYCPHCGAVSRSDFRYCRGCGKPVE